MALVRRSVTVDESNRIRRITISRHTHTYGSHTRMRACHTSLDQHYSSTLLYSCLYSALDTLPCALLVLYRLYPRRAAHPARRATPPPVPILTEPIGSPPESETAGAQTCAQTCDAKGKEEPGGGARRARWNFFSSRISIYNRIYNHHGCYMYYILP